VNFAYYKALTDSPLDGPEKNPLKFSVTKSTNMKGVWPREAVKIKVPSKGSNIVIGYHFARQAASCMLGHKQHFSGFLLGNL
jgi:hypothetical protein